MTWGRIDDKFHSHRKVKKIKRGVDRLAAIGLWTLSGSYSNDHNTDGHVDLDTIVDFAGSEALAKRLAAQLVSAGLWVESEGGWRFHDWLKYNKSIEERASESEQRKENGRKGGLARAKSIVALTSTSHIRDDVERQASDGLATVKQVASAPLQACLPSASTSEAPDPDPDPDPVPDPDPKRESALPRAAPVREVSTSESHDVAETYKYEACAIVPSGSWTFGSFGEGKNLGRAVAELAPKSQTADERRDWVRAKLREWCAKDSNAIANGLMPLKFVDWLRAGCPVREAPGIKGPPPIPPPPELSKKQIAEREAWERERMTPEEAKAIDLTELFKPKTAAR